MSGSQFSTDVSIPSSHMIKQIKTILFACLETSSFVHPQNETWSTHRFILRKKKKQNNQKQIETSVETWKFDFALSRWTWTWIWFLSFLFFVSVSTEVSNVCLNPRKDHIIFEVRSFCIEKWHSYLFEETFQRRRPSRNECTMRYTTTVWQPWAWRKTEEESNCWFSKKVAARGRPQVVPPWHSAGRRHDESAKWHARSCRSCVRRDGNWCLTLRMPSDVQHARQGSWQRHGQFNNAGDTRTPVPEQEDDCAEAACQHSVQIWMRRCRCWRFVGRRRKSWNLRDTWQFQATCRERSAFEATTFKFGLFSMTNPVGDGPNSDRPW